MASAPWFWRIPHETPLAYAGRSPGITLATIEPLRVSCLSSLIPTRMVVSQLLRSLLGLLVVISLGIRIAISADDAGRATVPIGTVVPDLTFTDIRTVRHSLSDLGEHKAIVLVFTTTDCPLVRRYIPRLGELAIKSRDRGVAFVAVNVGADDTIREMAAQAVDLESPLIFVKDYDHSCVRAVGVTKTPEVVVLDAQRTLRYRGRIDDQLRIGGTRPVATRHDLEQALDEILEGRAVSVPETLADGCLITVPAPLKLEPGVTWATSIASIVHKRCSGCHQPGQPAPFSLRTHDEVIAHAEMIAEVVRNESMPPWYAAPGKGEFQNTCALTDGERQTLLAWLEHGRPAGETTQAPEPPAAAKETWRIGKPDLVLTMLEEHTIPATGFVDYKYSVLPFLALKETWVEAVEIRPTNRAIVHHCNMAYVTKDGASEGTFITGYVPGGQPLDLGRFGNGIACRIPEKSGLGLQIHYTTTGKEERGKIQVGLRFPRSPVRKRVQHFLLDPRGWTIPPHDPAFRLSAAHTLEHDVSLLGMFTHMHVRGRDMTFYAEAPGESRETLLQIPNYNFEWQLGYEIETGKKQLPKGTRIEAIAHFDNSAFNPYNPDASASVRYGPQTVDEMFNGFVFYVDAHESLEIPVDSKTGWRKP